MNNRFKKIITNRAGLEPGRERVIFLTGPTAAGKSETAARLAKKLNAEIISCDSMQVYKGMGILTSMPERSLRKTAPHHLINSISSRRQYDVAKYRKEALLKTAEILKRGKTPLFAGGSGLYMSILIDGIFKDGSSNVDIRSRLFKEASSKGSRRLHKRLKEIDPDAAFKIHPNDTKRIIRALEVFEATGKTITCLKKQRRGLCDEFDVKIFCLDMAREELNKRIDARVEGMFKRGVVLEVKKLIKSGLGRTAFYAIGVREIKGYLNGEYELEEAKRLMKRNTRLYAKRQLTWFRKDKRINWVKIKDKESPKEIAGRILSLLKR